MIHNIIILDEDEGYAKSFAEYINIQSSFPFEARFFTSVVSLKECMVEDIDIILVAAVLRAGVKDIPCSMILTLSNDNTKKVSAGYIYKYQSLEMIIKQILGEVAKCPSINKLVARKNEMKIIGFYSPNKRSGQTSLAMVMGQQLAKKSRVLYISLAANSGLEELINFTPGRDMSDIMYDIKNGGGDLTAAIGSSVHKIGSLDYFPSMRDCRDLFSITIYEWKELLKKLETDTDYEYVLLDISDGISGLFDLLILCNRIYMTVIADEIGEAKRKHFYSSLATEYKVLKDKFIECLIPENAYEGSKPLWGSNVLNDYCESLLETYAN